MRRIVNILAKMVSAIVLALIFLPLLVALLFEIPAVQNFVAREATEIISRKLGTRISIDRVDIGLFYRVSLDGFYVEDFQRDTLLYAGRLDARIKSLGLFGGGLVFSRAELSDARFCLRETPDGEMNIKQVVDKLSKKDKARAEGKFRLEIERLETEGLDFCMERLEHRNPSYGVDFADMHLIDIRAELKNFTIDGPVIHTDIGRLAMRERSGFVVEDLAGCLCIANGCIDIREGHIRTAKSNIELPSLSLIGLDWALYKNFVEEVDVTVQVVNTTLSSDDIAYFSPKMKDWHLTLTDLNADVSGPVADMSGSLRSVRTGADTKLSVDFAAQGLPDVGKGHFKADISELTTSAADVDRLAAALTGKNLPDEVLRIAKNAGKIGLAGKFDGTLTAFAADAALATEIGGATCRLQVSSLRDGCRGVLGDVKTSSLQLGELLENDLLGPLSLNVHVNGELSSEHSDAEVSGEILRLGINGYDYDSLRMKGHLVNREFNGLIEARDRNLRFDFRGLLDLNDEQRPRYDFALDLEEANLAALGVNRRDSVSVLAARIAARAVGRTLDDLNGIIFVRDVSYRYNDRELAADSVVIVGRNSLSDKFIRLRSDFVDADYEGKTSYKEVFAYLQQRFRDYVPMLDGGPGWQAQHPDTVELSDGYSQLTVNVRKINPLVNAVSPGLQIADGSQLLLRINPANDKLSFEAASDYFERGRMLVTRLNLDAHNRGDSLVFAASTEDLYLNSFHMSRVGMSGGAKDNKLELITDFADTIGDVSGRIGFRSEFARGRGPAGRQIDLRLTPSYISRGEKTWNIYTDGITADTSRIRIDRFRMVNAGQQLLLDGVVSRRLQDSVQLTLHNFELAPFSQFTSSMGYRVDGRTNGSATMKAVLGAGEVQADIVVDSISINDLAVPSIWLRSRWDFIQNRAGILVQQRENLDTLVRGFYAPSQKRYYARATLDAVELSALDPLLKGVVERTGGNADVDIALRGSGKEANLSGQIAVRDFTTTVDFTQVTYTMPRAVIEVKNNHLIAEGVPLYDPEKNEGLFSIDLNLEHLSNISYSVKVLPKELMVLNTTSKDNDLFYGRIFASGSATIAGSKGGVKMDIVATTEGDSEFYMPLSGQSNAKTADFVTFVTPEQIDTTDYLVRKKLLFQQQGRKKEAAGSTMDITMALNVQDNTAFQLVIDPTVGSALKGRGNGMLNLHINPGNGIFNMYGDYTLIEGSFLFSLQNIISKKFIIESGSMIQWTGEPVDARLDINAVYKLKTSLQPLLNTVTASSDDDQSGSRISDRSVPVDCKIHIGGRLSNPQLDFSVVVPVTDIETQAAVASVLNTQEAQAQQFISLVALGTFSNSGSANIGASSGVATGLEMLTNQLTNWFSTDDYRIILNYRAGSEMTGDEVDFGFSTNLINNRLLVEVEGNYIIDNKQAVSNNVSNFMGEAHVTWLIDKSGNLRLKAFTQTIDRFDENQGLQETGIGISYKEDFNNFKDLKQRIRDRFTNKKRQKKRQARREEQARRAAEEAQRQELLLPEDPPEPEYDLERD
ncbi:translocation/assembly module TamB domain-containing protein [Alistipes putredinis]|uniref:translocation/assembly module TamB domain-containing protein n=1 Tax=Alistipes putredinis TaxID=28117 RepID=UPI00242BFE28|nr:translocation/assembly module TamB domain-containing protein [Alistipes putredinis]MBS6650823.1 translocation/assembly module TamB domain-containing protein [Alistipes putredinis]